MYKPNFCAECGERVAREHWRVWTSRRFCPACDVRSGKRRIMAATGLTACLVVFGFALGRAGRPAAPPLVVVRGGATPGEAAARGEGAAGTTGGATGGGAADPTGQRYGPDGTPVERPTDPLEVISICGARTKKGTPCSRRVRGTGRCWQHRGRPAMLPPQKLIVPS